MNYWRERILFSVLAVSSFFVLIALAPALYMAFNEGLWLLAIFDVLAFFALGCLLICHRTRFFIRAGVTLLIAFLVGVFIIAQAGFLSGGPAWLFFFAVLSGVLLGLRGALGATLLNAAAITLLAWLSSQGYVAAPPESINLQRAVTAAANFIFLSDHLLYCMILIDF